MAGYTLLRDAYFGTGGFATGSYLNKHKRETADDYKQRCKNAYYLNYFSPIVNALVDPIFKRQPLRDYSGPVSNLIEEFSEDIDGNKTDVQAFMKRAAMMAKLYGVCFIVVDNNRDTVDIAQSRADMLRMRQFPYAYCLAPENVDDYGIDHAGKLTYIRFHEVSSISDGAKTYRYTMFDRSGWKIWSDDKDSKSSSGTYNLGCVPVVPLFSRMLEQKIILPAPELLPIAKTAQALYNHCSWLGEILRNQTFPILTIPSLEASDLVIGTNNALGYNPDCSHSPAFISPPSDPASVLQSQISSLIQEMYRMASLSFMTSNSTPDNTSGVARQWEFERTNQQLANFSAQCAKAETGMMHLFALWVNSDVEYTVTYPDDFGIVDVAAEISQAQAVLDLGLTSDINKEVLKKVLAAYCPDLPDDRFDELVNSVDAEKDDQQNSNPPSNGETGDE